MRSEGKVIRVPESVFKILNYYLDEKKMISPAFQNESIIIFRCEDMMYPEYKGRFFILEKSLYGFFHGMTSTYSKGEIFDRLGIIIDYDPKAKITHSPISSK